MIPVSDCNHGQDDDYDDGDESCDPNPVRMVVNRPEARMMHDYSYESGPMRSFGECVSEE